MKNVSQCRASGSSQGYIIIIKMIIKIAYKTKLFMKYDLTIRVFLFYIINKIKMIFLKTH